MRFYKAIYERFKPNNEVKYRNMDMGVLAVVNLPVHSSHLDGSAVTGANHLVEMSTTHGGDDFHKVRR